MAAVFSLDLCDDYTTVCAEGDEEVSILPTVICRDKNKEKWHIGEEAYRLALSGKAVPTDKLVTMLKKDGRSTMGGRTYSAAELCAQFIVSILDKRLEGGKLSDVGLLYICLEVPDKGLFDSLREALTGLGLREQSLRFMSHAEAFIHYILSKDKELYNNTVAVFDLSEGDLRYNEFRMIRGLSRMTAICDSTRLEEAFRIDILNSDSGRKLADHILLECAKKLMDRKIFSSVFLTGKGFEDMEFAGEFKEFICRRRRVLYDDGIFARGALMAAEKLLSGEEETVLMLCDTRLACEISMEVSVEGRQNRLILAPPGTSWYGYTAHAEFIPQGQEHVDIDIAPVMKNGSKLRETVELKGFPKRPDRCTRVSMDMELLGGDKLKLCLSDLGFGDFFQKSGHEITTEIEF